MLLLKYSKNCCCFPPHNLWLYEGQHFSLSFLWENLEQVDCSEMRQCSPVELRVRVNWPFFRSTAVTLLTVSQAHLGHFIYSRPLFFLFLFILLSPHFPVCINSVIMCGFIWLIKASSFWAISQRTWIKLPYLCTGAMVGSARPAALSVDCETGGRGATDMLRLFWWKGKRHE